MPHTEQQKKPGNTEGDSVGIIEKAAGRLSQIPREIGPIPERPKAKSLDPDPTSLNRRPEAHLPEPSSRRIELNLSQLHQLGMITPDAGRSAVAEEFRGIKRTLLDRVVNEGGARSRRSNLIMVTSALPGEGKTFCSINLAMSLAMELDHTVLLVDADVARPTVLRTLGLNAESGLMDILLDRQVNVRDVMLKTNIETLSILPAGPHHRNATELLASQAMSKLLDEIANRYADRMVIFDSPPLLLTTEARTLASQMGQILMVVEAERTTQRTLKNALRQIEGFPNVNLVYNKAKAFVGGDPDGYYSYYK
jgi:exopolysaccharide/PEP-CTERM locus tyrosine autokinase